MAVDKIKAPEAGGDFLAIWRPLKEVVTRANRPIYIKTGPKNEVLESNENVVFVINAGSVLASGNTTLVMIRESGTLWLYTIPYTAREAVI